MCDELRYRVRFPVPEMPVYIFQPTNRVSTKKCWKVSKTQDKIHWNKMVQGKEAKETLISKWSK